jgi:hypothetical protein
MRNTLDVFFEKISKLKIDTFDNLKQANYQPIREIIRSSNPSTTINDRAKPDTVYISTFKKEYTSEVEEIMTEANYIINPNDNFSPSYSTKRIWLHTRKKAITYYDFELPGMYNKVDLKIDSILFLVLMSIEIIGMSNFYYLSNSIIFSVFFFQLDNLFGIFSHMFKGRLCIAKNNLVLAENGVIWGGLTTPFLEKEKQKRIILKYEISELIFYIIIMLLASFKISYLFYSLGISQLTVLLSVFFIFIAILTITNLGYFMYGTMFNLHLSRDKRNYKYLEHNLRETKIYRLLNNDYINVNVNQHFIKYDENGNKIFLCSGILQDLEVEQFINSQPSRLLKKGVALELLRIQLNC